MIHAKYDTIKNIKICQKCNFHNKSPPTRRRQVISGLKAYICLKTVDLGHRCMFIWINTWLTRRYDAIKMMKIQHFGIFHIKSPPTRLRDSIARFQCYLLIETCWFSQGRALERPCDDLVTIYITSQTFIFLPKTALKIRQVLFSQFFKFPWDVIDAIGFFGIVFIIFGSGFTSNGNVCRFLWWFSFIFNTFFPGILPNSTNPILDVG